MRGRIGEGAGEVVELGISGCFEAFELVGYAALDVQFEVGRAGAVGLV